MNPTRIPSHPTLNAAALRAGEVATYRAWLLLTPYLRDGRQLIGRWEARQHLCDDGDCAGFSRRYWRIIRQRGHGRYWDITANGDLYLYGRATVATLLGVDHLTRCVVMLDSAELAASTQNAKQLLYISVHVERDGQPTSRETLTDLTSLPRYQQLRYDRAAKVRIERNFAIIGRADELRDQIWKHGGAAHKFIDFHGLQGPKGATYSARTLPNSYHVDDLQQRRGGSSIKRINRKLRLARAATGSAERTVGGFETIYHAGADAAYDAVSRQRVDTALYPALRTAKQSPEGTTTTCFWHTFFLDQTDPCFRGLRHVSAESPTSHPPQRRLPMV